jgi:hypothetical protein
VVLREAARSWLFSFPNQNASACNGAPSRTERKGLIDNKLDCECLFSLIGVPAAETD